MSTEDDDFLLEKFKGIVDYANKWHQKKTIITKNTKSRVIDKSYIDESFSLGDTYDAILAILLVYPTMREKDLCDYLEGTPYKKNSRKMSRLVTPLLELGLVEVAWEESKLIGNMKKITKPFRLTLVGIMYVIINHDLIIFSNGNPLRQLLSDPVYSNNLLFEEFLYPYFSRETLLELKELDYELLNYLQQICKIIENNMDYYRVWLDPSVASTSVIDNKYILKELFDWDTKDENHDSKKNFIISTLKDFLYKQFEWDWIENATFRLDYRSNRIEITSDNQYAVIQISPSSYTVVLKYKNQVYRDILKMVPAKNPRKVVGKGASLQETFDPHLILDCKKELVNLFFIVQIGFMDDDRISQILLRDSKYQYTLQTIANVFKNK